jgi:UDP-N-acetylmuramate--alanine ligase
MSGIAEVLNHLGYTVSGSDQADSPTTRRLAALGITVHRGHAAQHVADADVLVTSSAIRADNPELIAARELRIPLVPRAEMLGELMRFRRGIAIAGTHGKTTTTSLTASVLAEAGLDPTFVIGGQLTAAGANARLGNGEFLVAEADESDGSFLLLSPVIAIVTNIDRDHLENFGGDFGRVRAAFEQFLHRLPFYGLAVLCVDDHEVAELAAKTPRRTLTYAIHAEADVTASDVRQQGARMLFDLHLPEHGQAIPIELNLPGRHNVLNALAACAVGYQLGVSGSGHAEGAEQLPGCWPALFHARRTFSTTVDVRNWWMTTVIIPANWLPYSKLHAAAGRRSAWWSPSSRIAIRARATCSMISRACWRMSMCCC